MVIHKTMTEHSSLTILLGNQGSRRCLQDQSGKNFVFDVEDGKVYAKTDKYQTSI